MSQDVFAEPEEGLRLLHKWQLTGDIEEEVQWKRRDQRLITVRLSGRVLGTENLGAARLEVIAEDVTERRALGEQLRQALKMRVFRVLGGRSTVHHRVRVLRANAVCPNMILGDVRQRVVRTADVPVLTITLVPRD